jgi:GAF domain-containing protein
VSDRDTRELTAAVAAGALPAEEQHRTLLSSIVEVARAIFTARAASIFLLDESADELVFEAVAGEGADTLVGTRFPSSTGIAGWVLVTRQPLVIDDLSQDPRFARDVAESLGYVPRALMAVPLLHEERALGVLEVLDRVRGSRFALEEMELLGLFGSQAAIALDLLQRARRAGAVLAGADEEIAAVAHLTRALDSLAGERREAGLRLLRALEEVLRES